MKRELTAEELELVSGARAYVPNKPRPIRLPIRRPRPQKPPRLVRPPRRPRPPVRLPRPPRRPVRPIPEAVLRYLAGKKS